MKKPHEIDDAIDCLMEAENEAQQPAEENDVEGPGRPPRRHAQRTRALTYNG